MELGQLAAQAYPKSVRVYYLAGAGVETATRYYVDPKLKTISTYAKTDGKFQGDGTVIEESASNGDLSQAFASFSQHQTIFNDDAAKAAMRRILCDDCGAQTKFGFSIGSAVTTNDVIVSVTSVGLSTSQSFVRVGGNVSAELRINGKDGDPLHLIDVTVDVIRSPGTNNADIQSVRLVGSMGGATTGQYRTELNNLNQVGTIKLQYKIKGMPSFTDFISIVPNTEE